MEYKDYYKILNVDRKAQADDIKSAYRRLARKYHPDVSKEKNAEEQFKNVQEAYEVLKDPEKRAAYDQLGSNWKAGQDFRPPPGWNQQQQRAQHGGFHFEEADMGGFSDFFSDLFGGRQGGRTGGFDGFQQRGSDQNAKVVISLEEAFRGATKTFQLQVPEMTQRGQQMATRTIKVTIPAGSLPGQQLRLAKQGNPGMGGGVAGDLFLEIDIAPNSLFTLKGRDIYITVPTTPWEAALGAEINIPTLAGKVGLKVPAGAQSGQKLRLKGRGMPGKTETGDQYIIIEIKIPQAKTAAERELYQRMAEVMPFNPRPNW